MGSNFLAILSGGAGFNSAGPYFLTFLTTTSESFHLSFSRFVFFKKLRGSYFICSLRKKKNDNHFLTGNGHVSYCSYALTFLPIPIFIVGF